MKRLLLTAVLSALMIAEVHAESFTISDIRVNGLNFSDHQCGEDRS